MVVKIHAEVSCCERPRISFNACGCDIGTATFVTSPAAFTCSESLAVRTSAFV
jgi:hypothetical protein